MKTLINLCVVGFFLLTTTVAEAKLTMNGKLFEGAHINTLRGILYDAAQEQNQPSDPKKIIPKSKFAQTIVWLDKFHKNKETYELKKDKSEEAELVINAVELVLKAINEAKDEEEAIYILDHWAALGKGVKAVYFVKQKQIHWKLVLIKSE